MAESYNTNLINVASKYVDLLNIPLTFTSLKTRLLEHPFYPSLFSLSDTFERFQIDHVVFSIERENFGNISAPFIAYLKNQPTGKDFVLVTSFTENQVKYIARNQREKKRGKKDFLNDWEKIVFKANPTNKSGEKNFSTKYRSERIKKNKVNALTASATFILVSIICLFLYYSPTGLLLRITLIFVIKLIGLAITILLLMYELNRSNPFLKSICSLGKQTNCRAVLQSKASKILGISWSEVGLFYFVSTFLFLSLPEIELKNKLFIICVANSLAISYIFFSIIYQWKIVKQWCLLCIGIQITLVLELAWSIFYFWSEDLVFSTHISPKPIVLSAIAYCLMIPITLWYFIKPLILGVQDRPIYKAAYKRLLYNPATFYALLKQQESAPAGYENIGIMIGNSDAEIAIIKVCNPYCEPCAKAHSILDEIIHLKNNVGLRLIFTASNAKEDRRGIAARHLLAVSEKHNDIETQMALSDWYLSKKKNYEIFASKYPINGELIKQEEQIDAMSAWCDEAKITYTPTFFVNGHRLPDIYKIEDLRYIL